MASLNFSTLAGAQHALSVGMDHILQRAKAQRGCRVLNAMVQEDFMHDRLELWVKHDLCSRDELHDGQRYAVDLIAKRIGDALGVKDPVPAKSRRVERRQLIGRGEQAKRLTPRPVSDLKRKRA